MSSLIESVDNLPVRARPRERYSQTVLTDFLGSEHNRVRVRTEELPYRTTQSWTTSLRSYVRSHGLPVRVFQYNGQVFLERGAEVATCSET